MTKPPAPRIEEGTDADRLQDAESTTGAPRWVKLFGIVILGLAVLLVGLKLAGVGPSHGPGRHSGSRGAPATGATGDGARMPPTVMERN